MLIKLYRNEPQGSAITGRLVIDGRWFCNTLERKGYQILALFYPIKVTHSPRFNGCCRWCRTYHSAVGFASIAAQNHNTLQVVSSCPLTKKNN